MKYQLKKNGRGFTIIEVMIVLAIAGLILAIVFLAVPQLQRNTRDNQRQSATTRVKAEIETYASNNGGTYPFTAATWTSFYTRYISANGTTVGTVNDHDPSTGNSIFGASAQTNTPVAFGTAPYTGAALTNANLAPGNAKVVFGAKCNGETVAASGSASATTHNYAVITGLDRNSTYFCVDNG